MEFVLTGLEKGGTLLTVHALDLLLCTPTQRKSLSFLNFNFTQTTLDIQRSTLIYTLDLTLDRHCNTQHLTIDRIATVDSQDLYLKPRQALRRSTRNTRQALQLTFVATCNARRSPLNIAYCDARHC